MPIFNVGRVRRGGKSNDGGGLSCCETSDVSMLGGDVAKKEMSNSPATEEEEENRFKNQSLLVSVCVVLPTLVYCAVRVWYSSLRALDLLLALVLSHLIVDSHSAVLHVVLDNEKFNGWPIVGPTAESFQRHHENPAEIARRPAADFFLEAALPFAVVGVQSLFIKNDFIVAGILCLFFSTELMMFSHRWAHMAHGRKPAFAKMLQRTGIIMSSAHHNKHHQTYDCNFAISSGWSNPIWNALVSSDKFLDKDDMAWFGICLGFYFLPTIVAVTMGQLAWFVAP